MAAVQWLRVWEAGRSTGLLEVEGVAVETLVASQRNVRRNVLEEKACG